MSIFLVFTFGNLFAYCDSVNLSILKMLWYTGLSHQTPFSRVINFKQRMNSNISPFQLPTSRISPMKNTKGNVPTRHVLGMTNSGKCCFS